MTTNPPVAQPGQRPPHRSSAHHPKSLWTLAFTELWERFSFYGLQGVLSFYLLYSLSEGGLDLEASTAVSIVGAYGGAVYLAQILGAWTADRLMSPGRPFSKARSSSRSGTCHWRSFRESQGWRSAWF